LVARQDVVCHEKNPFPGSSVLVKRKAGGRRF
jgi:hypothetical protein